jgi:hypothetical protein
MLKKDELLRDGSWFENVFEKALDAFAPDPEQIQAYGTPEEMTKKAARKAFLLSTAAGLPPGPLGWLTILPEIMALLKIQINLIYKIAKYFHSETKVNKTIILLILSNAMGVALKHKAIQKIGTRVIVKTLGTSAMRNILKGVGLRISGRILQRGLFRWIPFVLAPVFGAFSYSITKKVGREAETLLSQNIDFEETTICNNGHDVPIDSKFCNECGEKIPVPA